MNDPILSAFLDKQLTDAIELTTQSDRVQLIPMPGSPPFAYIANFQCKGLICQPDGTIAEADQFAVGIHFPLDYLRRANPFQVVTWLGPENAWAPNINGRSHAICIGRLEPATELVDIVYQVYEIITYNKMALHDGLNPACCAWARNKGFAEFPIDSRPLKRRKLDLDVVLGE